MNHEKRYGRFTSSGIVALTSNPTAKEKANGEIFGKPAYTYIQKKIWERRLGRSLETEIFDRNLSWGKLCERYIAQNTILPITYKVNMNETTVHPEYEFWSGSEDALEDNLVADFKCPKTLDSFCQFIEPVLLGLIGTEAINHIRENHKDGEKYYWQLVSNACIHNVQFGELIVFCPYKSELELLRELASDIEENQFQYQWIYNSNDNELPYIKDGGVYKNINFIRFEIPQEDKDFLTERVKLANLKMNQTNN